MKIIIREFIHENLMIIRLTNTIKYKINNQLNTVYF